MTRKPRRPARIEPRFDGESASTLNLRPTQQDRPGAPKSPSKKKKVTPRKKAAGTAKKGTKRPVRTRSGSKRRQAKRKKQRRNIGATIAKLTKRAAYWGCVLGIWGGIFAVGVIIYYAAYLPPTSEWEVPERPPNVKIVSANGQLIANRGDTGGEAVRLEQLPPYLPNAVIAIEDRRFRSHFGIDPLGLIRAMYVNLTAGTLVQGGSTLTQQLAKNLFLEPDRTIKRKMQEVVLAIWLETHYSKDEILEMYLNRVYLGAGAYGVDAAARRYYGKSARLVTIAEAATIAGLLKAPSRYSPARNPDLAEERAQLVLAAMHEEDYITDAEAKNALAAPARVVRRYTTASDNYAADWVMDVLPRYIGSLDTDIIVDTTIDRHMQNAAEAALRKTLHEHSHEKRVRQGAIVTLDTAGAVKALVGGADYSKSQFNRAVYAKRQPGSAFKPFVYLAAIENGMSPQTIRQDQPINIGGWSPKNYTKEHYGPVTLRQALAMSLNTVAAQVTYEVGPKKVAQTAKRLGIQSKLTTNLSLALGTSEVTPLEIAGAYVPFSNGGYGVIPHIIRKIRTEDGKVLYSRKGEGPGRVISRTYVGNMNVMMAETLATGTGRKAQLASGRKAGGKTGTSQDFRDAWFIGYTANLTTAVWLGNDDNSPTKRATGGTLPAILWKETMEAAHANLPVADLPGVPDIPASAAVPRSRNNAGADNSGSGRGLVPPAPIGNGQDEERRGPLNLLRGIFGGGNS
ncbi:penicillin-binding protein 1A [Roseibium hamelinense]|uniref:Penicillin-binding protein 1A n=1 Tax=Roseibium hamelinense TaxID=150831 RepID=A0A562SQ63_9HYPH|nr:transglycosylase domain-containing protein [Roseibium hamelinense]MTI44353.1 penicillin-binding protein [Roseibium hamelinense]TWI82870.1 penicillin-binding protein 1A [Roseibium hamelinense]